jgi:urease accessory protein
VAIVPHSAVQWPAPAREQLQHDDRHRRRFAMRGEGGLEFLLDLPEATRLADGDGLVLEGRG